uniref:Reverse transcriptase domain-containing protein n=1 Tax=Tanacetum cinerariifolium TaxID=118510 RepID=A0A6L2MJ61_TANCI|nr:hypothetical protein [Tanacetum cinerariifolium]
MFNIFNDSSEDFLEDLFSNRPSDNPTFSSHSELTSQKVNDDIFDSEGGNVLLEKLLDLDSTKDLHPPLHVNQLSGSTTYFSTSNPLLEEFADELALITFPLKYDDDLQFDIESDLKEIEFPLYQDIDSSLKDSIDQTNPADNVVDSVPEMFTDEHALDYSSPSIFDEYDDDFLEVESDIENVYDNPFDSKGEKIKESKLLIDELDLPCDFLPFEYDSFISQDLSKLLLVLFKLRNWPHLMLLRCLRILILLSMNLFSKKFPSLKCYSHFHLKMRRKFSNQGYTLLKKFILLETDMIKTRQNPSKNGQNQAQNGKREKFNSQKSTKSQNRQSRSRRNQNVKKNKEEGPKLTLSKVCKREGLNVSSAKNKIKEEFADELALITFPSKYDDDLQFDNESDLKEIEFLIYQDIYSSIKDLIDQTNHAGNVVDSVPEMFTDEHALDYLPPPIFDEYDDDFLEVESDTENVYDDPFDSNGEKIKEVDALPSTNKENKIFNLGILIQEKSFEIITRVVQVKKLATSNASSVLKDFDPPFYEPLFKEVPKSKMLLLFSFENEEKVFKPGIHTSEKFILLVSQNYLIEAIKFSKSTTPDEDFFSLWKGHPHLGCSLSPLLPP